MGSEAIKGDKGELAFISGSITETNLEPNRSTPKLGDGRFKKWFETTKRSSQRQTVTLRMEQSTHDRLKVIQQKTDAKSANEVVINALAFYDEVFREVEEGNTITLLVRTKSGECVEYDLFSG